MAARAKHFDLLAARQIKNNSTYQICFDENVTRKKKWREKTEYSNQNPRNVEMWRSVGANGIVWFEIVLRESIKVAIRTL